MEMLKIPKRKRRLRQKALARRDSDEENKAQNDKSVTSVEDLLAKKKRRLERQKNDKILQEIHANIQRDVEEREKNGEYSADYVEKKRKFDQDEDQIRVYMLDFDDNFLLNCERDSDNEDQEEEFGIKEKAKLYLDQDQQQELDQAIQDSKKIDIPDSLHSWHHEFFNTGVKNIRQPSLISRDLSVSQKESHISELSGTSKGRAYLLQTGCMKDWYHSGWKCPNYIYQWLFEVVGLEINAITAKNALSTLFEFWSVKDDMMFEKYIELKTFKSVLLAYDTIPSQLVVNAFSSTSFMSTTEDDQPQLIVTGDDVQRKNIPLSQLGWMIKAFSFSIRLFTKAYTTAEIRYTIRVLLQISIDKTGYLVTQDIQTAIDNCLSALTDSTWETEVKTIANDICDMLASSKRQMHVLDACKTMNERSRYFRRMIGLTGLERSLEKDVPGSTNYISTDQTVIKQIAQIFNHPEGFFKNTKTKMDYGECVIRVALLDAAIGTDENDIKADKDIILQMADDLRFISLQMGARIGIMEKTMANEMIQRVWSRISYAAGRKSDFEL